MSVIDLLVGIYCHTWIGMMYFQRKVPLEKLIEDDTYSYQNVGYEVLWVFVWTIREILGVSVAGDDFLVFVDGLLFLEVVQKGC